MRKNARVANFMIVLMIWFIVVYIKMVCHPWIVKNQSVVTVLKSDGDISIHRIGYVRVVGI
jgi:hypothetical protein